MGTAAKTAGSFVKQFMAALKGDTDEVLAQKVHRQAVSALEVQIASLKGDTVAKEDAVETAKERLQEAVVNGGVMITNRTMYVETLIRSKNQLQNVEQELETHLETMNFLEEQLKAINS